MEIELKLACNSDALVVFEEKVLSEFVKQGIAVEHNRAELFNEYYDTPDRFFKKRQMGCRVRSRNGKFEQTIKTKGQVEGGLHQRPEYNVDIPSSKPDLRLFPSDIWGDGIKVKLLNSQIEPLFATNFERNTFLLTTNEYKLEVVFDMGKVTREQESIPICEIELELVSGEPKHLFDIAEQIVQFVPARLSDETKAQRGYQLLQGNILDIKSLPPFLPLDNEDSTEDAFCKALQLALFHWQRNQYVYAQSGSLKALTEIRISLSLLLQSVALYLPVLQCKELLSLHKQLLILTRQWAWQEQLHSIHQLRSRKGPFSRRIPKNQSIMNYLMGRREGLLNAYKPAKLNMSEGSVKVQLAASRLLLEKPWREDNSGAEISVKKHAQGWLSQSWQTLMQSLPNQQSMDEKQYLALEVLLMQSLTNGFLLSELFADSRGQFRAPWLDLATGIKELKALLILHDAFDDLDIEDKQDFANWIQDKTHSVIKVMEQTREVAMDSDIYW
jgi:triphosphatase